MIKAWAVKAPNQLLERFDIDPGELGPEEVEIAVEHCGICHSDISVMNNDWGVSTYPVIPGHEVIGRIVVLGAMAKGLRLGQLSKIGRNPMRTCSCSHRGLAD